MARETLRCLDLQEGVSSRENLPTQVVCECKLQCGLVVTKDIIARRRKELAGFGKLKKRVVFFELLRVYTGTKKIETRYGLRHVVLHHTTQAMS